MLEFPAKTGAANALLRCGQTRLIDARAVPPGVLRTLLTFESQQFVLMTTVWLLKFLWPGVSLSAHV